MNTTIARLMGHKPADFPRLAKREARQALAFDMYDAAHTLQSRAVEAAAEAFHTESPRMAELAAALPEPWRARALALL